MPGVTRLGSAPLLLLVMATASHAAEFGGSISVGVANTDNVRLAREPLAESETIYQLLPSLSFMHESQRFDVALLYGFQGYQYEDLDQTATYHQFDGRLTATLVRDALYFDAGAVRSQSLRDPDEGIPTDGLPLNNNLVDRDEFFVNPRFERTFGQSVSVNASYRVTDTRFGDDLIQEHTTEAGRFEIENYRAEQGFTWAARYSREETDYDTAIPWEYQKASAELGFWVNGNLRVFGSGGEESAWDDFVDRSLADPFWEAGFAYSSGEKISAEFAAGERSFGTSWRGNVDIEFRRGSIAFSYAETPTTSGQDRYRRGSLVDPDQPDDFLNRPGSAERYIAERLNLTLALDFRRTGLTIVAFDENRTGRFSADGTPRPDESQRGITVRASWQMGVRTAISASGSQVNRKATDVRDTDFVRAGLGLQYRLGNKTSLSLNYSYSEEDPAAGFVARDYVANVVSLNGTYTF